MSINLNGKELGIAGIIIGVVGTAYGIWREKKSNDLAKKLDTTLTNLENKTEVNISQDVVNKAVKNAVERHASAAAKRAADQVGENIRDDMDSMIRKDVDRVYSELKGKVSDRVDEEIDNLDFDAMTEEAQKKFGKMAFDSMCRNSGFSGQLVRTADNAINGNFSLDDLSDILRQFPFSGDKKEVIKAFLGKGA